MDTGAVRVEREGHEMMDTEVGVYEDEGRGHKPRNTGDLQG